MNGSFDKIICRELQFECEIGFHEYEKGTKQRILIDFEVEVPAVSSNDPDEIQSVRMDYFEANKAIAEFLNQKRINLLETVALKVCDLLIEKFHVLSALVTVTKFPLDMPNAKSVSYVCFRKNKNKG